MIFLAAAAGVMVTPQCARFVSTLEINRCETRQFEAADRALNAQWKLSLAAMRRRDAGLQDPRSVPPTYTVALLEAQRSWLKFRDTNCLVWGYRVRGGTAQPAREIACRTSLTLDRVRELRDQVKAY